MATTPAARREQGLGAPGPVASIVRRSRKRCACHGGGTRWQHGADQRKENSGAPLPGAPNVGSWVPAKPLRFDLWGAREDFSLTSYALTRFAISASSRNLQHKGHKIYTGLGHRCGVIPYSSVWWWIASWAEDEQYKGKNSLLRRGVLVLGELVWVRITQDEMPPTMVASPIYRGPGPLPKY